MRSNYSSTFVNEHFTLNNVHFVRKLQDVFFFIGVGLPFLLTYNVYSTPPSIHIAE